MHAGRHAERRRRFFCGETSPIPRKNIIFDLVLTKEAVYERKTRYRVAGRRDLSCRKSVWQAVGRTPGELVLSEVDFSVEEGEFVYLIGRVGSGKSTLLKTLYADVQLLVGEGCVVGFDLRKLRRRQIPYLRRKIGIVFQDYQLLTDRNVFQNLYYVMRATGWRAEAEIRRRIDEVLQLVGLEAKAESSNAW